MARHQFHKAYRVLIGKLAHSSGNIYGQGDVSFKVSVAAYQLPDGEGDGLLPVECDTCGVLLTLWVKSAPVEVRVTGVPLPGAT
jgi:hypothetical protein